MNIKNKLKILFCRGRMISYSKILIRYVGLKLRQFECNKKLLYFLFPDGSNTNFKKVRNTTNIIRVYSCCVRQLKTAGLFISTPSIGYNFIVRQ